MQSHLAIASVQPQEWKLLYEEAAALKMGTIFQELNMPFYMAEDLVTDGNAVSEGEYARLFAAYDAMLYLDTHPQDQMALEYYKKVSGQQYQAWNAAPLPWEGGAVNVVL